MAQDDLFAWKDDSGIYHAVAIDIVTNHQDDRTAEVTSFPIEKGAPINDHIIHQPDTLTLDVCQTQSPFPSPARPGSVYTAPKGFATKAVVLDVRKSLFKPGGLLALTTAVGNAAGAALNALGVTAPASDVVKATVFVSDNPVDRIGELHDQLVSIIENGRPCKVVFRGKTYPDYYMTRVSWKTQKGEVGLGRFTLSFQAVRTVETATAELPDPTSLRLMPSKAQTKPAKTVDPKVVEGMKQNESFWSRLLQHAGR
jgi:hypothetical protein